MQQQEACVLLYLLSAADKTKHESLLAQTIGLRHLAKSLEGFPVIDQLCHIFLSCSSCSHDSCFYIVTLTLFTTHTHLSWTGILIAFKIIFCCCCFLLLHSEFMLSMID